MTSIFTFLVIATSAYALWLISCFVEARKNGDKDMSTKVIVVSLMFWTPCVFVIWMMYLTGLSK